MKKQWLFALVAVLLSVASFAQKNSVVGKWQIASIKTGGLDMNLENPADLKKMMSEQMEKEGRKPDSAQLEMVFNMLTAVFNGMRMEFKADGTANFVVPNPQGGEPKTELAKYTADYAKGIMTTVSTQKGTEKKEDMSFKFEGEYLILHKEGKGEEGETLKLKKAVN
jgi:hypothetical protein